MTVQTRSSSEDLAEASAGSESELPTLLVVDDDPDILRIVKYYLVKQGYNVLTARDGQEALEIMTSGAPVELLLSDVMMPRMDGLELLQAVRQREDCADVPIILISAEGEAAKKVTGLDMGADDYLTKPFNFEELMARVRNHIRMRRLQKELIAANDQLRAQNAQFIENLEAARAVQMALIPDQLPSSPHYQLGSRYVPLEEVGGDFFDAVVLEGGGKLGVFIADVCGHGIASAFITAMTKISFRNACFNSDDPATLLAQINKELRPYSKENYVTAFYGIYDVVKRRLKYAGGGHPPLVINRPGQEGIIELESQATFLGFFNDITYQTDEFQIEPGDRAYFYTDGIYECANKKGEQYGMERFAHLLKQDDGKDIQGVLDSLLTDLNTFIAGTHLADDITIVGVDFPD